MRAVWLTAIGGPEVLVAGDAPDPEAGTGQALVDVAFANITNASTQLRVTGTMPYRVEPPMVMGNGVGGTVVSVGADVDPGLVGQRVVGSTGGSGGYAERAAVDAGTLFEVPDELEVDKVRADGGADVVFDGVGGDVARSAFGLLDRGGRMVSYGLAGGSWADIPGDLARDRGVDLVHPAASPGELRGYTEAALAEAVAGWLRPVIGQRFPLERAADAHALIETRATVGKTLLVVA